MHRKKTKNIAPQVKTDKASIKNLETLAVVSAAWTKEPLSWIKLFIKKLVLLIIFDPFVIKEFIRPGDNYNFAQ